MEKVKDSPLLIDMRNEIHAEALMEAFLFCCLQKGSQSEKMEASMDALRKCAEWFPIGEGE